MAITLNSQPTLNNIHSPYRPMEIKVTSNAATINKMKCFIHLNDSATADNASTPIVLDPDFGTTNEFTFDLSAYLAGLDSLTYDIQTHGSVVSLATTSNSIKKVSCTFTEVLISSGLLSDGASLSHTSISDWFVINGAWQHDQISSQFTDFKLQPTGNKYFLTNYRGYRDIKLSESYYLSFFTTKGGSTGEPAYLQVIRWTGRNATGSSSTKYRTFVFTKNRFHLACGALNINNTFGSWYSDLGVTPTSNASLNSSYGSYQLAFYDASSQQISERLTFNLDFDENEDHTRIKFMNRLGAFEYFTFKGYRERSVDVRKQYYKSPLPSSYTVDQGGDRVLSVDSRDEFVVHSGALNEEQRLWLIELIEGVECYVVEGSNHIPIKVRAGKTKIIDEGNGLFTIKMTYQYANENRRQNG